MTLRLLVALAAFAVIALSVHRLEADKRGLERTEILVDGTPVTILRQSDAPPAPAVVIAHGFAGSRQLMESFAVTLARNGYVAVSFDFRGHGRNEAPLTGDVREEDGATRTLLAELEKVVAFARRSPDVDGRVALVGHSMASDIVVRAALADETIEATVAVSMFSNEVSAEAPRNLLIVVGAWERFLADEALRAVALAAGSGAEEGATYGRFEDGSARRASFSPNVEHVGVLFSSNSMIETRNWLDSAFGRSDSSYVVQRGPWIALLIVGVAAAGWPLAALLPKIPRAASPPRLSRRRRLLVALAPAVATPVLLWPAPTDFLPILVADYLAVHFATYGALVFAGLWASGAIGFRLPDLRLVAAAAATTVFGIGAVGAALDAYVASFVPHPGRLQLIATLLVGAVCYTLSDAWLTAGAAWWLRALTKVFFLISLSIAIALDTESLFFLIIIFPVIVLFFLLYGLFGRWVYQSAGHPSVAGFANGAAVAWALGVSFPIFAG